MHSADLKTSTSARTIKLDDGPLRIEDIIDIAEGFRPVSYYPIARKKGMARVHLDALWWSVGRDE